MKCVQLFAVMAIVPSVFGAAVLDIDFTDAEGFSGGSGINGINGMAAQATWLAGDAAGTGYASSASTYQRAKSFADFTLEIGETVVIETTLRITDSDGTYANADCFGFGFAEKELNTGQNIPSIQSWLHTTTDGGYWFGAGGGAYRIAVPAEDAGDWIKFTQTITRSSTANEFVGTVSATNLTDGTDLGSTPAWTQSTTDGSWGGTMNAGFRAHANTEATALQLDRWVVSTNTNTPPPPTVVTNNVDVVVNLTRQLYIGGVSTFDRERVINWHDTGTYNNYSADEAALMIDTNKTRFGRSVGGMQWIRSNVPDEDPLRPGYVNTNALISWCQNNLDAGTNDWPWLKLGYQPLIQTDHPTIFPGGTDTHLYNPGSTDAAAEWASIVWQNYWTAATRPRYFEPINEPFVNKVELGTDAQGIVDFQKTLIDRIQQDVPDVKAGGPCLAFPAFSNNDYGLFTDEMGRYIDQVGDTTDFLSWHIYSTFFDDGDTESHSVGANTDWQLDLVENYSVNQTGREIPLVISEFGGGFKKLTSWRDEYSELRDWYILKSIMGKTMSLYERPDRVEKAIPFIVGKATWYEGYETNAYPFVAFKWNGSAWEETHLTKFYAFWKDVEGERFSIETSDPDIQAHAFVTNTTVHICLNNIDPFAASILNLDAMVDSGISVSHATVTRLYWNGTAPVLESHAAMGSWSNITLQAEEAAIIHLTLNQAPSRDLQLYQKSHYGNRTMVAYLGVPETFTIKADMNRGAIHEAVLKVGVTRNFGVDVAPLVTFNGNILPQAADWPGGTQEGVPAGAGGRRRFDGTIRMDIPTHLIQAANTVDISFATTGGHIASAILDVTSELPFDSNMGAFVSGNEIVMDWDSSPSFNYVVSKTTNLASAVWTVENTLPGNGSVMSFTNSIMDPSAFFKVEAVYP